VEIAKADFQELGITRGNGFNDEVVQTAHRSWGCGNFQ
jgi:hypothetical protein